MFQFLPIFPSISVQGREVKYGKGGSENKREKRKVKLRGNLANSKFF